jgi:hypothetical protein
MIDCDILIARSGIAEAAQVEWAGDESGRLGEFIWRLRSSARLNTSRAWNRKASRDQKEMLWNFAGGAPSRCARGWNGEIGRPHGAARSIPAKGPIACTTRRDRRIGSILGIKTEIPVNKRTRGNPSGTGSNTAPHLQRPDVRDATGIMSSRPRRLCAGAESIYRNYG